MKILSEFMSVVTQICCIAGLILTLALMTALVRHETDIPIREAIEYRDISYKGQHYIIRQLELDSKCNDCHVTMQLVQQIIKYEAEKKGLRN